MQRSEATHTGTEKTERIRWVKTGDKNGPVLILFVGIHGNEPAGIKAIDAMSEILAEDEVSFRGSVYAVSGNLQALAHGVRYLDTDLNRLWERFGTNRDFSLSANGSRQPAEYGESLEIKRTVESILEKHGDTEGEVIFADLHTTSSRSCAFILLNDTLANRELARKFPVPQILGIEENIHGTLLSYINNLGFKAVGFEAGAHRDRLSVERSKAFLWLLFHYTGAAAISEKRLRESARTLAAHTGIPDTYYEIIYHKQVDDPETFDMIAGFENFDPVEKGTALAFENGKLIRAPVSGRIFMPLYQNRGHDGFMIIREVSEFWLEISALLRKSFLHGILKYLPGVSAAGPRRFEVNLNVARFLVKDVFHLLGYRITEKNADTLICYRR